MKNLFRAVAALAVLGFVAPAFAEDTAAAPSTTETAKPAKTHKAKKHAMKKHTSAKASKSEKPAEPKAQ